MEADLLKGHGKKENQKLKSIFIYFYLMKYSDENHAVNANELADVLKEQGIYAERRSIYRDIEAINIMLYMLWNDVTLEEAEEIIETDEYDDEKAIVYSKHLKGFYVKQRRYDVEDVQLIAECIYAAKFVEARKSNQLLNIVLDMISDYQSERIRHSAFLTERTKTNNKDIFSNVMIINAAMSRKLYGEAHTPEKIKFKYQKRVIDDIRQRVDRRSGLEYCVSPYELLINDGNYYLLAYSDIDKAMRTYRVDRMKGVKFTGISREGEEEFRKIDMLTYTRRVFSMYGGRNTAVVLHCNNELLDTIIDRFGIDDVSYNRLDGEHFSVLTTVEVSNQFFGWVLGLGNGIKIVQPPELVKEFKEFLAKVSAEYE